MHGGNRFVYTLISVSHLPKDYVRESGKDLKHAFILCLHLPRTYAHAHTHTCVCACMCVRERAHLPPCLRQRISCHSLLCTLGSLAWVPLESPILLLDAGVTEVPDHVQLLHGFLDCKFRLSSLWEKLFTH